MKINELHHSAWQSLLKRREKLPHALMLVGQQGLGKAKLAALFAAGLLCEQVSEGGLPCGQCLACNWFAQGNHPDFRLLQPEAMAVELAESEEAKKKASQQITIDQVRALDEFMTVGTHRDGLRIILINPVEAMNRSTANSLLKSLEEPSPNTLFLLISSEPNRVLPTLRSRCQLVSVPVPVAALAEHYLQAAGVAESGRWLALAGGGPLLAATYAQGQLGSWLNVFLQHLSQGKQLDPLLMAADLDKLIKESKGKLGLRQVVEAFQKWLVDLNLAAQHLPIRYFLPQQGTIETLAAMIPVTRLLRAYRSMLQRRREVEQPLNARLFLESLLIDYRALFAK